jgi:peptidyl-prolyl cis-trans isomerase A (cyclophilin A)
MPRPFALSLLWLLAAPAAAQSSLDPVPNTVAVVIRTDAGDITVALDRAHAPLTTANFLRYVDGRRLDGTTFYRAMKPGGDIGLIQGGTRDPKRLYLPVPHEPTTLTGLHHVDGTISMARGAAGSARADFFITAGTWSSLDANPAQGGDNAGFAAFGQVVAGMDVVHRILDGPTSPTAGEGAMKGQMLATPVRIVSIRRAPPALPAPVAGH